MRIEENTRMCQSATGPQAKGKACFFPLLNRLLSVLGVAATFLLTACGVVTLYKTPGLYDVRQATHTIRIQAVVLPTLKEPRWWIAQSHSADPKNALSISVGPPGFKILDFSGENADGRMIPFSCVYRSAEDKAWLGQETYEGWAPTQNLRKDGPPAELQVGTYHIHIRYLFKGEEYRADWTFEYTSTHEVRRARFPTW